MVVHGDFLFGTSVVIPTLPEGLWVRDALAMNVGLGWDGHFPASAHAARLFIAPWFPGEVSHDAPGDGEPMGGITPPEWRRFWALVVGFRTAGLDLDRAAEQALHSVRIPGWGRP